jgi:hypothetical protein
MNGGDERMVGVDTSGRSSAERLDRNVQGQLHSERVELGRAVRGEIDADSE